MRQEARRVPTTFLYATERRFLSSTVSSPPIWFQIRLLLVREIAVHGWTPLLLPYLRNFLQYVLVDETLE